MNSLDERTNPCMRGQEEEKGGERREGCKIEVVVRRAGGYGSITLRALGSAAACGGGSASCACGGCWARPRRRRPRRRRRWRPGGRSRTGSRSAPPARGPSPSRRPGTPGPRCRRLGRRRRCPATTTGKNKLITHHARRQAHTHRGSVVPSRPKEARAVGGRRTRPRESAGEEEKAPAYGNCMPPPSKRPPKLMPPERKTRTPVVPFHRPSLSIPCPKRDLRLDLHSLCAHLTTRILRLSKGGREKERERLASPRLASPRPPSFYY